MRTVLLRMRGAGVGAAICVLTGSTVLASEIPDRDLDIRGAPLRDALVAIATASGVSVDLTQIAACGQSTVRLRTRAGPSDAFARALIGTPCLAQQISPGVFRIVRRRNETTPAVTGAQAGVPSHVSPGADDVTDVAALSVLAPRRLPVSAALASAASVVSGSVLVSQGVHDTSDLALITPSLTVTNLGLGRDKIFVRGLSDGPLTGQSQSMVGLYLDDVRLTFSAPDPNLRIIDMAEVDVLRGPQGALFGAGSLGGVVQMVSRRPEHDALTLESAGSVSSTAHGAPSQSFDSVLNVPTADGRGALRLVAYEDFQGGYLENTTLHRSDTNQTLRRGFRATADYEITPTFRATVGAVIQGVNSSDSQYKSADAPDYTRTNAIYEPHDNDFSAYHVSLDGDLAGGHFNWTLATVEHSLFSRYDATIAPPARSPSRLTWYAEKSLSWGS